MLMLGQWNKAHNMVMNAVDDSTVEVWCLASVSSAPADKYDSGGDGGKPSVVGTTNASTRTSNTGTSTGSGSEGAGGGGAAAMRARVAPRSKRHARRAT